MKKTIIAIIAVLLVCVLCFALFACNNNNNENSNNNQQTTDTNKDKNKDKDKDKDKDQDKGIERTADNMGDYEACTDLMLTYVDQYLTNNATDNLDVSTALQTAVNKQAAALAGEPISSIKVALVDGTYKISFVYKDKSTFVYYDTSAEAAYDFTARKAERGEYAGYAFASDGDSIAFLTSLADVYNAFLRTFQDAIDEGTAFGEDYKLAATGGSAKGYTFGGSVEGAFFLNYGVGDGQIGPISYGLRLEGVLGYDAKDTEVALEVIDEQANKAVVGLYYQNTTVYLMIDVNGYSVKQYLDQADLNAIFGDVLGASFAAECEHNYVNGYCTKCGKVEPPAKSGEPFYKHEPNYTSFKDAASDLTGGNEIVGTVVGIVGALTTNRSSQISGGTRYQYKIELGTLLDKILSNPVLSPLLSGVLNPITESILPQFDIGSFKGVGGDLVLSFDVKGEKLAGVQVSYNVAQKDFRWNKEDKESKIYGPVNVAITVKDFAIDSEKTITIENKSKYEYFSPMNGEITADITYADANDDSLDGDYKLIARAEFNPFTIFRGGEQRDGEAEIILDKADGSKFAHVYIHDFTYTEADGYDCTVTVYYDGKYYQTLASQSDFFTNVFADFVMPLVSRDTDSNLAFISSYVWDLIDQFSKPYTYADFCEDYEKYEAELNALAVTKVMTKEVVGADGKKTTLVVMENGEPKIYPSSTWLDDIKSKALYDIDAVKKSVGEESEKSELKAAIKAVASITAEAKSEYSAQLKLEGKDDSFFEGFNLMAILTNFSDLKGLFVKDDFSAANPSVFDYKLDLTDPQLWVNLDYKAYNSVIDILKLAIPKLQDLDATAATVKVDMNYKAANKDKLAVNVAYKDYLVDVLVDWSDCFDDNGFKSTCTMKADITVKIPNEQKKVITYLYAVEAKFVKWDEDEGTITVTFKESDGETVRIASDTFVEAVITQDWDGKEYRGFDVKLTLNSRKADGTGMNAAHVYAIEGKYDPESGMYSFGIAEFGDEENGIVLKGGNVKFDFDKTNKLSFDIPAPVVSFDCGAKMGEKDVSISVKNLTIANWGKDVNIKGIDTTNEEIIANTAEVKAADAALYDVIVDLFGGFFYSAPVVEGGVE